MKKVYRKPAIVFENFTLSTGIAGNCEVKTNTPSQMQCPYGENDYGYPIFLDGVSACVSKVQDGNNNTFCYHIPIESNTLFNS